MDTDNRSVYKAKQQKTMDLASLSQDDTDEPLRKGRLRAGLNQLERPRLNPGALSVLESLTW